MKFSLEDFWPKFFEVSPAALGFTFFVLLPLVQHSTGNNIATYTPVKDTTRPSRPPHLPKIAELIPVIDMYQPKPTFS